jgi:hypothetical protein
MNSEALVSRVLWSVGLIVLGQTVGLGQARPSNPDHVLDLLADPPSVEGRKAMPAEERTLHRWLPPPPPADSARARKFPFEVTLLSPDLALYALGEHMIFEVLLKNTSNEAIDFPWSRDGTSFRASMPGARRFVLTLKFTHPVLGSQEFASQTVFGADAVPGSVRTIRPNETLLILAQGRIELLRAWSAPPKEYWEHSVKVRANLILAVPSHYYPPEASQNEMSLQLRNK